jgi:hypothetical protein
MVKSARMPGNQADELGNCEVGSGRFKGARDSDLVSPICVNRYHARALNLYSGSWVSAPDS